jgi:hypothetical protein
MSEGWMIAKDLAAGTAGSWHHYCWVKTDVNDSNNEIGGLAGISIGQPLDTVKVRLQAMVITIT